MSIKIVPQGDIPSISLNKIQYDQLHISVKKTEPYITAVSGKVALYGEDDSGKRYYGPVKNLSITNIDALIASLPIDSQIEAMQALAKFQEGLGFLAEISCGFTFVEIE